MDYDKWDTLIQEAINALAPSEAFTRAQAFLRKFPTALTEFRTRLHSTSLVIPLADFQKHPTYLLRWLLADSKDEGRKLPRSDLQEIIDLATKAIQKTQEWRSGQGENWTTWGFKDMDDLYNNYKTPPEQEQALQAWYFQRFCGNDVQGYPVHFELLPITFREDLILPLSIRRVVNNEHTLRHRLMLLNPPPEEVRKGILLASGSSNRTDALSRPILGATWVLDARQLSLWYSTAIYKTTTALLEHSAKITAAHYPEQGYRAVVLNLGVVFGSLYNLAMKAMPATTQVCS